MYRKEIVPGMCIRHFSTEDYGIIITEKVYVEKKINR